MPNIYFLHNDSVTSFHSSVLGWLGYGWNATPKTAQPNTLLINNITFNMVNNSKNALCIFCCDADRCHTVNAREWCTPWQLLFVWRATCDKQSNELLFIWFGVVCCALRRNSGVLHVREICGMSREATETKRRPTKKIKTKWGKHVNRGDTHWTSNDDTSVLCVCACANTKSIELGACKRGNVSFYYDLSMPATHISLPSLVCVSLLSTLLSIFFGRKLFVFNGYYYYGFFISSLALNRRNHFSLLSHRSDSANIENVNWLPLDQNKCNNSTISIKDTADDGHKQME